MSHINYSSNTSESDLNEISFSLIDSNEEQEISYKEVEELKNDMIFEKERRELLKNTRTVVTTSGSLCSLPFSTPMAITSSPPPPPPMSSLSPQKQLPLTSSHLTSNSETNRKCLATTKHDRRMAKQMTERKRRDRINALLDNLRTLILKLLHKNPRHHRKLEKADILELVVSFLKKELNQNRFKTTSSYSQQQNQNNCRSIYSLQNLNFPSGIESSSASIVYPDNRNNNYYPHPLLTSIPQSNPQATTNYYIMKNNDNGSSNINNYPIYDHTEQNTKSGYPTISYQSSYKHQHQSLPSPHYSQLLSYQPIVFTSTDDMNKENQLITGAENLKNNMNTPITKDLHYYPTCNYDDYTFEKDAVRQPLNILNKANNFIGQNICYQSDPKLINQTCHHHQRQQIQPTTHLKMYPDILNSHLNYKLLTVKDEDYSKSYPYNNYDGGSQSFRSVIIHEKNNTIDNSSSVFTYGNERICSKESTSFERLWRPYV